MDPGQACLFSIVCRGARGGGDEQAEEEGRKEAGFGLRRAAEEGVSSPLPLHPAP